MLIINLLAPLGFIANAVSNVIGIFKRETTQKENLSIVKAKEELNQTITQENRQHSLQLEKIRAGVQLEISDRQLAYQRELEQKRAETQAKLAIIQAKNQVELQQRNLEFQAWLKEKEWGENRALTEYIQNIQLQIAADNLEFQKWKVAEEKKLALELKRLDAEITLACAAMERENQLILMQERYETDHNPLWLTRRQFLADAEIESLRIFLSPIDAELMGKFPSIKNNVNTKLTRIAEYYSSEGRAVKFFGDIWTNVKDAQQATAQAIFADYKSQPMLILDAQMEEEYFYLQYSFWGSNWQTFRSGVLVDNLSLIQQQYLYAKREVKKWLKQRQASSKPDEIDALYGEENIQRFTQNLETMKAEAKAIKLGIDPEHFKYQIGEKEVRQSAEYLVLLHCINACLWTDIYFLLYAPTKQPLPPLLFSCMQEIKIISPKDYSQAEIAELISGLVKSYGEIYQILASRGQGVLLADLYLQMGESCWELKLKELAKQQVTLSVESWLTHRGVTPVGELEDLLKLIKPVMSSGDRPYLLALKENLAKLGVDSFIEDIVPFINLLEEQEKRLAIQQQEIQEKWREEAEEAKQKEIEEKLRQQAEEARKSLLKHDLGKGVFLELVEIPAGSFLMGGEVEINIESFLFGKYPVTQDQWEAIMGNNPSKFKGSKHPVDSVGWDMAQEFCEKLSALTGLNFRLPSEAEWEYACRAGTTTKYFFGDDEAELKDYAWYQDNSDGETHPVGEKKPNPWGLYDILGNVWDLCRDDYVDNINELPKDGKAKIVKNSKNKVCRGGSYDRNADNCHSSYRGTSLCEKFNVNDGLRVALTLPKTFLTLFDFKSEVESPEVESPEVESPEGET